jgi:stage V sporulation protein B
VRILYPSGNIKDAAVLISLGSVSVIFYCLSTVTNGVLQGLGKPSIPVIDSAIALGVNVVLLALGVWVLDMGVVAILMATVMYSMTVSALNSMFVKKYLNYQNEIKTSFLLPLAAGAVMGAAVGILYWIPVKVFSGFFKRYIPHALWTVIVVLIGMVVYVVAYALISGKSEEELRKLPAGTRIVQLLHFLHIRRA